jgi:hypothetical protein
MKHQPELMQKEMHGFRPHLYTCTLNNCENVDSRSVLGEVLDVIGSK